MLSSGTISTLAGSVVLGRKDGAAAEAQFYSPIGVALSGDGGSLFVADCADSTIRKIDVATGTVSTLINCQNPKSVAARHLQMLIVKQVRTQPADTCSV